jgi:DNA-binding transcriptional regulator PaaX
MAEINILRLSEYLGERSTLTYQALGWLAREGKVQYEQKGSQIFVSLTDAERRKYIDASQKEGGMK